METSNTGVVCGTCRAVNSVHTQYCSTCGIELQPTPINRSMFSSSNSRRVTAARVTNGRCVTDASGVPKWCSSGGVNVATQTVGLYYPSQRDLARRERELSDKEQETREHKAVLTAVSPGRGYWRKQMEHICGHLKAHAADWVSFRAQVAEPRLGKIISASTEEDGDEFILMISFKLHEPPRRRRYHSDDDLSVGESDAGYRPRGVSRDLLQSYAIGCRPHSSYNRRRHSLESEENTGRNSRPGRKTPTKKTGKKNRAKKTSSERQTKTSPEDRKLLKEIGKNGEGRPVEIRHLIEEGASAQCVNKEGVPAVHVAVLNGHTEAVQTLVEEGADVNVRGPTNGNSALHEAVLLGPSVSHVIDTLLTCGARVNMKNDKAETPYDLAVKNGQDAIVKKLASQLGQSSLDKLTKPRAARTAHEV